MMSSQSCDRDMSAENINRPVSFKVKKMTPLIMKKQKIIVSMVNGRKKGQSSLILLLLESQVRIQKIHWNVSNYLLPWKYWTYKQRNQLLCSTAPRTESSYKIKEIIKCLNQIISENKPYNLRLCTFTLHKFQEKNLNLNRDLNSDLQISSLALSGSYSNSPSNSPLEMFATFYKNQDSLMANRQTKDLEVRVQIPVQVQIFLLKFMKLF